MSRQQNSWTHTYACTLAAPPERVFSALTDRDALRLWFAEHVEIDARRRRQLPLLGQTHLRRAWPSAGGAHDHAVRSRPRLWIRVGDRRRPGRGRDDARARREERRRRTHDADAAAVLDHRPAVPYGAELVDDLWRFTLGNLDAHLRGGEGIVLPDYTNPSPEIRLSIVIDAPRDRVFRALMDPQALNRWIATGADVEPRPAASTATTGSTNTAAARSRADRRRFSIWSRTSGS